MVIDKSRILIGLLLVCLFILSYFFNLDLIIVFLVFFFSIFELFRCRFINNFYDYIIILLSIICVPLIYLKYEMLNILNIFLVLSILIILFLPNFYLKRFFLITVLIFLLNFFSITVNDRNLLYLLVFIAFFNDTTAYIFGKAFKGPLIVPSISPKKTWSGTGVSFILTTFIIYQYTISLFLSCLLSISLFFGDIFYSFIKRKSKLKDFSNFLLGHGGVLDRIDSMFFFVLIVNYNFL